MENPESQIAQILERNKRVEADKAWEVSWFRRLLIAALTYVGALLFIWSFTNDLLWRNAAVPAGAYLVSTLSLPWIKRRWIKRYRL
jgi:hypothetical protein